MLNWLWKLNSVSCTVAFSLPGRKYSGLMKSLKMATDETTMTVTIDRPQQRQDDPEEQRESVTRRR